MSAGSPTFRAIAAFRAGRPVQIQAGTGFTLLPLEAATSEQLNLLDPEAKAPLLLSHPRAAALSLTNEREAADPSSPVLVAREQWLDRETALDLADASRDMARAPATPLRPVLLQQPEVARAAIRLARAAGLLPALWWLDAPSGLQVCIGELTAEALQPRMTLAARAKLPLDGLPPSQIAVFRSSDDGQEHVALIVGAFGGRPPLVRLHSECLTGDVFGSLKCDCGPQLKEALRLIGDAGGGVLLYLRQEGRGIGLANKIRAYALQDRGLDTVEANARLGFADDERDYAHAAGILKELGVREVQLLTNNPRKVAGLESAGICVVARVAHQMPANPHNADYLEVKRSKSGHLG